MVVLGLTREQWIDLGVSLLIVLATAILARWLIDLVLKRVLNRIASRTATRLDNVVIDALRRPLLSLAVVVALNVSISRLNFLPESWQPWLGELFFVLYFVVVFASVWRLVNRMIKWYGEEVAPRSDSKIDNEIFPFTRRLGYIVMALIGMTILLAHFQVDVSALVTTLGIGSLAIALAAQAALSDTVSGFVIMVDRPYRIGDRIEIQDLDTWGDVVDIGLRSTRIRTRDNRMVIVPNSVIGKSLIVNYSYPDTQYRIQVHIGVAYGTDVELARTTMINAVRDVDGVLDERPIEALFLEFGESALIFRLRWWIESYVDTRRMFDAVNSTVYRALQEAGIEIPAPQREVIHKFGDLDAASFLRQLKTAS
ncbi:MAG: mechanosensitive ion channel [Anaerolineales bacterium]|nr:mechanosensitive ion channel [Anaerolineales bacterium]